MFHALNWAVVSGLLALWSLAAWAFHAVAGWAIANTGALVAGTGAVESLRLPEWLTPWLPPEVTLAFASTMSAFLPYVEAMLSQVPALAGGVSVAVWVIWAIGSVVLVVMGLVATRLIDVLRHHASIPAV